MSNQTEKRSVNQDPGEMKKMKSNQTIIILEERRKLHVKDMQILKRKQTI